MESGPRTRCVGELDHLPSCPCSVAGCHEKGDTSLSRWARGMPPLLAWRAQELLPVPDACFSPGEINRSETVAAMAQTFAFVVCRLRTSWTAHTRPTWTSQAVNARMRSLHRQYSTLCDFCQTDLRRKMFLGERSGHAPGAGGRRTPNPHQHQQAARFIGSLRPCLPARWAGWAWPLLLRPWRSCYDAPSGPRGPPQPDVAGLAGGPGCGLATTMRLPAPA